MPNTYVKLDLRLKTLTVEDIVKWGSTIPPQIQNQDLLFVS